ncbi:MAG TPA: response regulator transcription factor [Opitutaceae bacterium]|jgi:DNA-binding NarL/FixJ family response regulator|nr:response regulator transcription factor [Opitutaceae bacterium]
MKPASAPRKQRILLVDDHPFMRAGLAQLLGSQPGLEIAGQAGNPAEALRLIGGGGVDLVLTDVTMPGRSGLDFIKDLHAMHPALPILVVSMHDEGIYAERALRAGARGYIMKEAGADLLLDAVRRVLAGSVYVSPAMSARVVDALARTSPRGSSSPIAQLTDREFEIFQLIGLGKSTRDIAAQLHLSSKTVDVHRSHIKEKLKLDDVTALVRHAVRWVETGGQV